MNPDTQTIYIFTACVFALLMFLETLVPRQNSESELASRWINNFSLSAVTWYASNLFATWAMIWFAGNVNLHQLRLVPQSVASNPVAGFLLLLVVAEFIGYWGHRVYHRVSWLWPIHAVHHADTRLDVSTSLRNHPLETLLTLPLITPAVVMLGVTPAVAATYQLFVVASTAFGHANIRLPQALDRVLRRVIITPDYHRLHHSSEQRYTDSNFGTLVPWFDYLFGTAKWRDPRELENMEIGLEYWREKRDKRIDQLLVMPFRKIRRPAAAGASQ
ncbi:sterol desaturase family protein [Haliea sp. E17]|uniref:sterol desaturase family protein n=1 Tax=Haliea sp. E17 TaxID=3401576 RepID=UPI003AADB5F2